MLIRSYNNELVEYPDDLVMMMLASPFHGDLDDESDWSIAELNCLIHGMLGTFFDETMTLEQNIEKIKQSYAQLGSPSEKNLAKARALVNFYNENLSESEIGFSDHQTIRTVFSFNDNNNTERNENIIEQPAIAKLK